LKDAYRTGGEAIECAEWALVVLSSQGDYSIYGGDISQFAGQTGELRFTSYTHFSYLDGIQFSTETVPPVPSLQVRGSGNQIVLSWPLWATNYILESSVAIGPTASWAATTNAATVSGQSLVVTNPITTPSAFYRLRQP